MGEMTVEETARLLEVDPAEIHRTLAVGLEILGPDALEVHGDIRGRGFIARRDSPDSRDWRIRLSAPQQITREPDGALVDTDCEASLAAATERIALLDGENAALRTMLQEAQEEARIEREERGRLEGKVQALEEQWAKLNETVERALGARNTSNRL